VSAFRDDRDGVAAERDELRRRLDVAEARATAAEAKLRKLRRRAVLDSVLVCFGIGGLFAGVLIGIHAAKTDQKDLLLVGFAVALAPMGPVLFEKLLRRAGPDEILVVANEAGPLGFIEPGRSLFRRGLRLTGALPAATTPVKLRLRGAPCKDGAIDVDVTTTIAIGAEHADRIAACRKFLDATAAQVVDAALPLVTAAARRVIFARTQATLLERPEQFAQDIRDVAKASLRELGLAIGPVTLVPPSAGGAYET
jgi:hypothetical protein